MNLKNLFFVIIIGLCGSIKASETERPNTPCPLTVGILLREKGNWNKFIPVPAKSGCKDSCKLPDMEDLGSCKQTCKSHATCSHHKASTSPSKACQESKFKGGLLIHGGKIFQISSMAELIAASPGLQMAHAGVQATQRIGNE